MNEGEPTLIDQTFLLDALARLSLEGGDCLDIEAKSFSEYSPSTLGPTLSAFANLPGGGTILLGVKEKPIEVLGVSSPDTTAQSLGDQARKGFSTPLTVDIVNVPLDDRVVTVGRVHEVPANEKPCRWKQNKTAYLRQYDGDYRMSQQEEQQLLLRHHRPRNDIAVVPGTSREDLQPELLARFLRQARAGSSALRNASDDEILSRLNVETKDGELTIAGLYTLGTYPQQYLPNLNITAAVITEEGDSRARDRLTITGPVPDMLVEAVSWVEQVTSSSIRIGADGHATDAQEFPLVAVRELIANALIHRDLSEPALTKSVDLRVLPHRLVLSNPGGLWGLSTDQLGQTGGRSAVNEYLYTLAGFTTDVEGRRVIEGLGTGIHAVREALAAADLEEPRFLDTGVRFTVLLPRAALLSPADLDWLSSLGHPELTRQQRHALADMRRGGQWTNARYREEFDVDSTQARTDLQHLVDLGLAETSGENRWTTYQLADSTTTAPLVDPDDGGSSDDHTRGASSEEPTTNTRSEQREPGDTPARPLRGQISVVEAPRGQHSTVLFDAGPNGAQVWDALREARTIAQIVATTGLTRRQVSYAVGQLEEAGVVRPAGRQGRSVLYARSR